MRWRKKREARAPFCFVQLSGELETIFAIDIFVNEELYLLSSAAVWRLVTFPQICFFKCSVQNIVILRLFFVLELILLVHYHSPSFFTGTGN